MTKYGERCLRKCSRFIVQQGDFVFVFCNCIYYLCSLHLDILSIFPIVLISVYIKYHTVNYCKANKDTVVTEIRAIFFSEGIFFFLWIQNTEIEWVTDVKHYRAERNGAHFGLQKQGQHGGVDCKKQLSKISVVGFLDYVICEWFYVFHHISLCFMWLCLDIVEKVETLFFTFVCQIATNVLRGLSTCMRHVTLWMQMFCL